MIISEQIAEIRKESRALADFLERNIAAYTDIAISVYSYSIMTNDALDRFLTELWEASSNHGIDIIAKEHHIAL